MYFKLVAEVIHIISATSFLFLIYKYIMTPGAIALSYSKLYILVKYKRKHYNIYRL